MFLFIHHLLPNIFSTVLSPSYTISTFLILPILLFTLLGSSFAKSQPSREEQTVIQRADAAWTDGDVVGALDILDRSLRNQPQSAALQKLRGDILTTARRHQEAIDAYDAVLTSTPEALPVRWAKWSELLRSGRGNEAIAEFQRIAKADPLNPLVPMQMARELRKLDRLEESVEWYEKAVTLVPHLPGWRLALARARFDILEGRKARDEVKHVLQMVSPGSPEEAMAKSLQSVVYGATKERGRRYQPIFSPEGTAAQRKEWASIRAEAWRLQEAGHYAEAEPLLRKILVLKPSDYRATHELGITLMELGKCEEAIATLQTGNDQSPSDEVYADSLFRIGQCHVKLEQWEEALPYFELLHDAAVEFDTTNKDVPIKADTKILNQEKLGEWLTKVRSHVPGKNTPKTDANKEIPLVDSTTPAPPSMDDMVEKTLQPENPIFTRASLMGRDADFSWFRFLIPASRVMRDDQQGGAHEFIPINPSDTFFTTHQEIYVVFGLVSASFDEVSLITECFLETSKITGTQQAITQDQVVMAMNDQTGYFVLYPPETGWTPGLHRCGLFVGEEVSAYTHADEFRFRIVEPKTSS